MNESVLSLVGLCVRCSDILRWKIMYNKYKKRTKPTAWFVLF